MGVTSNRVSGRRRIALHIKPPAEKAVRAGHPWIFAESILKQSHEGQPGDLAVVFDRKNRFLAIGLYDPHSSIRVRVLQHLKQETVDEKWFGERLAKAIELRAAFEDTDTNGYRLVHGENDGLPGLVIDKYHRTLVMKLYSGAWEPYLPVLVDLLLQLVTADRILLRLSRAVRNSPGWPQAMSDGQILFGPPIRTPIHFNENGLVFAVDPVHGHKTGFYLDQRDNRTRVGELISELGDVHLLLDVFAYTGAFSIYSARAGVAEVVSLDASKPALLAAQQNFQLNNHIAKIASAKHTINAGDAFAELQRYSQRGQKFDAVLIDPPSFASKKSQRSGAMAAYGQLAHLGLDVVRPGGLFVMSSCSRQVSSDDFFACVIDRAKKDGRQLVEIARTGHPKDHPINFAQGAYLKCLFAIADDKSQ